MQIQIPSEIFILRNIAQSCATSNHIHIHARPGAREKGSRRIASTLHTTQWQTQVLLNDKYKYCSMTNTSAAQWQIQVLLNDKYKYCSITNTGTARWKIQVLLNDKHKTSTKKCDYKSKLVRSYHRGFPLVHNKQDTQSTLVQGCGK